jgi:hypothetical protein
MTIRIKKWSGPGGLRSHDLRLSTHPLLGSKSGGSEDRRDVLTTLRAQTHMLVNEAPYINEIVIMNLL